MPRQDSIINKIHLFYLAQEVLRLLGVKPCYANNLTIRDKVRLSISFEELFALNRVGPVIIVKADPFLAANIIRGERIFFRDKYATDEYE